MIEDEEKVVFWRIIESGYKPLNHGPTPTTSGPKKIYSFTNFFQLFQLKTEKTLYSAGGQNCFRNKARYR